MQAVRGEAGKAHERLAKGEGLLASSEPYRYPMLKPVWSERADEPFVVNGDPDVPPEMRRYGVFMPSQSPFRSWDERFPPVRTPRAELGCIREWQGRCHRPSGTSCGR